MNRALASFILLAAATPAWAAATVDPSVAKAEAERVAVMQRACSTAVAIFAHKGTDGGSGVVISPDGYALSNFHVTSAAGKAMKCGMADGRLYDAVIVGIDPVGDTALVKLLGRDDFPYSELADSDEVRQGDWVFAVGNPFLLANDFKPSVSYGIISGVHRYQYPSGTLLEYTDCLQTDAAINPGNSGGPLFDAKGRVIGINGRGSFEKRGRVNVGVGYAISSNQLKNFLGHLKSGRIVDHATMGARVANDEEGRVIVSDILEDSDAYRRGLRYGDEIVAFGGRPVHTANAFKNVLGIFPKGWQVPLTYRRKGTLTETLVRLAGVHGEQELVDKMAGKREQEVPPQEQPGEEPDPKKPKPKDADKPQPGRPQRPMQLKAPPKEDPIPESVKPLYEARSGYANYHFNRARRAEVWARYLACGDFSGMTGTWSLRGQLLTPNDTEFRLSDRAIDCSLPGGHQKLDIRGSLADAADPPESGGLLAALHLWRRLLTVGPEKFGDLHYEGTMPLAGHAGLVDALWGTAAGVQCRFLFDPSSGQLLKLEMFRIAGDDPCELVFGDFKPIVGRQLPQRLDVRHGDRLYATFKLTDFQFGEVGAP